MKVTRTQQDNMQILGKSFLRQNYKQADSKLILHRLKQNYYNFFFFKHETKHIRPMFVRYVDLVNKTAHHMCNVQVFYN